MWAKNARGRMSPESSFKDADRASIGHGPKCRDMHRRRIRCESLSRIAAKGLGQAMVETWIAARADFFVGTVESRPKAYRFFLAVICRFTMSIQLERSFLGKPHRSSQEDLE